VPAGIDEQQSGDRGVHAARHRHDHPGHGSARDRAQREPGKRPSASAIAATVRSNWGGIAGLYGGGRGFHGGV
jgi:hypothetical protein